MCGIVGVFQYDSEVPREIRQRALRLLFSYTMLQTESRGEDATGLYQVHANGDWALAKKGVKVSKWLFETGEDAKDPVIYNDFVESWLEHPQELTTLVGHCRKATVGSRGHDNDDNHPFAVQLDEKNAILGVHNGTLNNHETIFKKLPRILKRQGRVDSEAIFHLLFHLSDHGTKPFTEDMIKELGRKVDGACACIVVNSRFPNIVATFRDTRPLEFFSIIPLNIVIATSDKKFVEAALESYDFIRQMMDPSLPKLQWHDRMLVDKDFRIFDTLKGWPAGKPVHADLDRISVSGTLKPFSSKVEAGWEGETKTFTSGTQTGSQASHAGRHSGRGSSPATGQTGSIAPKTSKSSTPPQAGSQTSKPSPSSSEGSDDEVALVEMEIGCEEEVLKALEHARSIGLCPDYTHENEIAAALGMSMAQLEALDKEDLANLLAQLHFALGYALARHDGKAELEGIRKRGRDLHGRLEKVQQKKEGAQKQVWERNQIIAILLALAGGGYKVTLDNIKIALDHFPKLQKARRTEILRTAEWVLGERGTQSTIRMLLDAWAKSRESRASERSTASKT